ncbi:MAG: hypothetical protein HXX19_08270 [Rhodoferax sp.]|nr:hypothetical protein [Rhodoferax sp.]
MSTPNTPKPTPAVPALAAQLTQELIQMRDALVKLSLCLKDWQFELDQQGERAAQKVADQALEKFRLQTPAGSDRMESSQAPDYKGS